MCDITSSLHKTFKNNKEFVKYLKKLCDAYKKTFNFLHVEFEYITDISDVFNIFNNTLDNINKPTKKNESDNDSIEHFFEKFEKEGLSYRVGRKLVKGLPNIHKTLHLKKDKNLSNKHGEKHPKEA
uniref:Uncharacterized protein n=1 Tax=Meloidogyne floridensis TaxID=298350 RepID=A0A915P9X1_9BILA